MMYKCVLGIAVHAYAIDGHRFYPTYRILIEKLDNIKCTRFTESNLKVTGLLSSLSPLSSEVVGATRN